MKRRQEVREVGTGERTGNSHSLKRQSLEPTLEGRFHFHLTRATG